MATTCQKGCSDCLVQLISFRRRSSNLVLARCGLFENSPFDPAGVVFSVQRVARERRPLLPAIELIVHAVERQRLDLRARGYMKIGIFVPAVSVKEKFADAPRWP